MLDEKRINRILEDHERRISLIESEFTARKPREPIRTKKSLPDFILELRDSGFFSQSRTVEETHEKLQEIYVCELDRVETALRRLGERKQLRKATKTVDDKIYKAYVW